LSECPDTWQRACSLARLIFNRSAFDRKPLEFLGKSRGFCTVPQMAEVFFRRRNVCPPTSKWCDVVRLVADIIARFVYAIDHRIAFQMTMRAFDR